MKQLSKHITQDIKEAVMWVNTLFKGKVTFCGSFGLVFNGLLERPIHDIDCITDRDWYGKGFYDGFGQFGTEASNSEKFEVNGVQVRVFKICSPNGITVDVMFREDGCKSKKHYFERTEIKVEVPESAIEIKTNYLKLTGRIPNKRSAEKHQADLEFIKGVQFASEDPIFIDGGFDPHSYESKIQKSKNKDDDLPF